MPTDFTEIRNWIAKSKLDRALDGLEADLAQRDRSYALYRKQLTNYRQQLSAAERSAEITQEQKQLERNKLTQHLLDLTDRLEANEPPATSDRLKDLAQTGGYVLLVPFLVLFAGIAWLFESLFEGEIGGIFVALLLVGFTLGGMEGRSLSGSLDDFSFYKSYVKRYTQLQTSALDGRKYLYTPDRSYRYHPDTGVELVPPNDKIQAQPSPTQITADRTSLITTGAAATAVPAERIQPSTLGTRAAAGSAAGFAILYAVSRNPFTYLRQMWGTLTANRQGVLVVAAITGIGVGYLGGKWFFTRKEPRATDAVMEAYYADQKMMAAVYADKRGVLGSE